MLHHSRWRYCISITGRSAAIIGVCKEGLATAPFSMIPTFFLCFASVSILTSIQSSLTVGFLQYILTPGQWMSPLCQESKHVERSSGTLRTNSTIHIEAITFPWGWSRIGRCGWSNVISLLTSPGYWTGVQWWWLIMSVLTPVHLYQVWGGDPVSELLNKVHTDFTEQTQKSWCQDLIHNPVCLLVASQICNDHDWAKMHYIPSPAGPTRSHPNRKR